MCLGCGLAGMLVKFQQETSIHPGIQSTIDSERLELRPFKKNFVFPEDRRFFWIKFDADPCIHGGGPFDQKTMDRRLFSFT